MGRVVVKIGRREIPHYFLRGGLVNGHVYVKDVSGKMAKNSVAWVGGIGPEKDVACFATTVVAGILRLERDRIIVVFR